jgi:hypothetical protein
LVGVALNVAGLPPQIEGVTVAMLTLVVGIAVTDMVMAFEVAGDPNTHTAFDVRTQVMTSLFAKVLVL